MKCLSGIVTLADRGLLLPKYFHSDLQVAISALTDKMSRYTMGTEL